MYSAGEHVNPRTAERNRLRYISNQTIKGYGDNKMIISNVKDGTTLLVGRPIELTHETTMLFGSLLEKTPEILLAVLATYSDEIGNLDPNDYGQKLEILCSLSRIAKKCFKESKSYGD